MLPLYFFLNVAILRTVIGNDIDRLSDNEFRKCSILPVFCPDLKYRTFNGVCNNRLNPLWGAAFTPYRRLIHADYADGVSLPRISVTGEKLPNPIEISNTVFQEFSAPSPKLTHLFMVFGQALTHDIGLAAKARNSPQCCSKEGKYLPEYLSDKSCYPIPVPKDDPVFKEKECLTFSRTLSTLDFICPGIDRYPSAEQINAETHLIDMSFVYGTSKEDNQLLRAKIYGKMKLEERKNRWWLPHDFNARSCLVDSVKGTCYRAGDPRTNQNTLITIMHTILAREHNRMASFMSKMNYHYTDEKIFEEVRKISIAIFQKIVYYDYLPIVLGRKFMIEKGLIYKDPYKKYEKIYNKDVNPSVFNFFATVCLRYFHTQINGKLDLTNDDRKVEGFILLKKWYDRPSIIEVDDNFSKLIIGMSTQSAQTTDNNYDPAIKRYLFTDNGKPSYDLRAIDINRAREHGNAGYNDLRVYVGLPRARSFEGFADTIPPPIIEILRKLYKHVDDVESVPAGSTEIHIPGTLLGPSFHKIIFEQFYNLKFGDRFFYENDKWFTKAQRREIQKATIAGILCDSDEQIKHMQKDAFQKISIDNPLVSCDEIPRVDLTKWKA